MKGEAGYFVLFHISNPSLEMKSNDISLGTVSHLALAFRCKKISFLFHIKSE